MPKSLTDPTEQMYDVHTPQPGARMYDEEARMYDEDGYDQRRAEAAIVKAEAAIVKAEAAAKERNLNNRSSILFEAEKLVNGDRNNQYGDPLQDFQRTADFWTTYIKGLIRRQGIEGNEVALQPHDVAVMVALLKISRITWNPEKRDSWTDLAGYTACGWDCVVLEDA